MSKISDLNYSQHITLADNFKQKNEALDTWYVGMNDFARIAGESVCQSTRPRLWLRPCCGAVY